MKPKAKRNQVRRPRTHDDAFQAKPRDSMHEWIEERLGRLVDLEIRRMFGGAGLYAEGTMFGILHAGRVYLKTDDITRSAFTDRGTKAFQPPSGPAIKSYYEIPADIVDDDEEVLVWARRSLAVAKTAPARSKTRFERG